MTERLNLTGLINIKSIHTHRAYIYISENEVAQLQLTLQSHGL